MPVKQVCVQWCAFHVKLSQKLHTGLVVTNFQRYSTHQYDRRHGLQCQTAGVRPSRVPSPPKAFQMRQQHVLHASNSDKKHVWQEQLTQSANKSWDCHADFHDLNFYKAGSSCDRCDWETCSPGFYREECVPGRGAQCSPCSNALPASARYTSAAFPIHDFHSCGWKCSGIYARSDDRCKLGLPALIALCLCSGALLATCVGVSVYNTWTEHRRPAGSLERELGIIEHRREHADRFLRRTEENAVSYENSVLV